MGYWLTFVKVFFRQNIVALKKFNFIISIIAISFTGLHFFGILKIWAWDVAISLIWLLITINFVILIQFAIHEIGHIIALPPNKDRVCYFESQGPFAVRIAVSDSDNYDNKIHIESLEEPYIGKSGLLITLITLMHFIVSFEILKLVTLDWIFYLIMGLIWIMLIIEIIVSLQILSWKFMKPNLISLARILSIPTSGDILMIAHLKGVKMWESDYTNKQYIESIEKRRSDNELTIIFENKYIFYFKP